MKILPTSCDARGFRRIDPQNRGWELQVLIKGETMEGLLSRTVLDGMIRVADVPEEFKWMAGTIKQYIIEGDAHLNEIKSKLDEQEKYDSNDTLEGDTNDLQSLKLALFPIEKGVNAGTIEFWVTNSDSNLRRRAILRGYPIDLNTHLRIPRDLKGASKFLPIALFSPTQVGKSTLLASLFAKGLKDLPVEYQHDLSHWENTNDFVCDWYMKQAEDMKMGTCPPPTQPTYTVPPVFINLVIPGTIEDGRVTAPYENVIVGIYDFSGEALNVSGAGYDIVKLLPYMKGIIYLTGPEIIDNFDESQHAEEKPAMQYEEPVIILTLSEQAAYQRAHGNNPVKGLNGNIVPKNTRTEENRQRTKPDEFYHALIRYFGRELRNIHLAFVIAQCDRLEGQTCVKGIPGIERAFVHDNDQPDLYQSDNITTFTNLTRLEESIITENFITDREKKSFEARHTDSDGNKHVTYHMVSATGCKCEKIMGADGKLEKGSFDPQEYDPIRVAEPFLVCIREMLKYGMYYED